MKWPANPELIRNVRSQLRPGRMLAVAIICAALSLVVGYSMARVYAKYPDHLWGMRFLVTVLYVQGLVLTIGGGIACLHAIYREKDRNTFDFQRVTRLSPLELATGKLFGAPATAYFLFLCLMPAAAAGAIAGRPRPSFLAAAYAVLLLGSLAIHALALLGSLLMVRGAATAAVIFLLAIVGLTSFESNRIILDLGRLNPLYAVDLLTRTTWKIAPEGAGKVDLFFGKPVNHAPVLLVIYLSFVAWPLLALARNIKRDPAAYELYTPLQSLALALYTNFMIVAFFRWKAFSPLDAQAALTTLNMGIFLLFGLTLLRNRDRLRRHLQTRARSSPGWLEAVWPAPHLLAGIAVLGVGQVWKMQRSFQGRPDLSLGLAIFRLVFFGFWLVRDVLYLQWMNLRRGRRSLLMGILYLLVYYACLTVFFGFLGFYGMPERVPYTAIFLPSPVFILDSELWQTHRPVWIAALVAQILIGSLFVYLQRRKLQELAAPSPAPAPSSP